MKYLLLGVIQGLSEFLPVSSSGHIVLAEHWLGLNPPGIVLEVAVHVATLFSVVIVYRKDIIRIFRDRNWGYIGLLALGTAVTVVLVYPVKDIFEGITESEFAVRIVGAMLVLTACWLALADVELRMGRKPRRLTWPGAAIVGIAQAAAAMPGISRSGATIGAMVERGESREEAARFSFLLSIPVIAGAGILTARDLPEAIQHGISVPGLIIAFIAAMVCGIGAIYMLLWLLKRARLVVFSIYCLILGVIALMVG